MKEGLPHPNTSSSRCILYVSVYESSDLSQVVGSQQKDAQSLPAIMIMYTGLDSLSSQCPFPLPSWGFLRLSLSVLCSFLSCVFRQYTECLGPCTCGATCVHMREKCCRGRALVKSRTLKLGNREEEWKDKNMQMIPCVCIVNYF